MVGDERHHDGHVRGARAVCHAARRVCNWHRAAAETSRNRRVTHGGIGAARLAVRRELEVGQNETGPSPKGTGGRMVRARHRRCAHHRLAGSGGHPSGAAPRHVAEALGREDEQRGTSARARWVALVSRSAARRVLVAGRVGDHRRATSPADALQALVVRCAMTAAARVHARPSQAWHEVSLDSQRTSRPRIDKSQAVSPILGTTKNGCPVGFGRREGG